MAHFNCEKCSSFDDNCRCCTIGKANPKSKKDAIAVLETLGSGAICFRNHYRESLLLRMYQPNITFSCMAKIRPGASARVEVEILEDNGRELRHERT